MKKLNTIDLDTVLVPMNHDHDSYIGVRILVDGNDFLETVHDFERQQRIKEGTCADQMRSWLRVDWCHTKQTLSGWSYDDSDKSLLLMCKCGDDYCWPLEARIILTNTEVVWKDFSNMHRKDWPYHKLGSFRFSRKEYEDQLAKIPDIQDR